MEGREGQDCLWTICPLRRPRLACPLPPRLAPCSWPSASAASPLLLHIPHPHSLPHPPTHPLAHNTTTPAAARPPTHQPSTHPTPSSNPLLSPTHPDFERGFIRAETVGYDEFVTSGGFGSAKEKGLLRLEGKEYVVKEGDVMLFRFNV